MSDLVKKIGLMGLSLGLLGGMMLHKREKVRADNAPRLPKNVVPVHYDLRLKPDMRTAEEGGTHKFDGRVAIDLDVRESTYEIKFNAVDLAIHRVAYTVRGTGNEYPSTSVAFNVQRGTCTVAFGRQLEKGTWVRVVIDYTGELNDKMAGFYRSRYTNSRDPGKWKLMACTQFEACDARQALPCWDEPALKATFSVTLVVPENLVALSNMEETSRERGDGGVIVSFAKTPVMSTYLLAFVVGEFDVVSGKTTEGVDMRVFTPVGKADQGRFALDVGLRSLSLYTKYFMMGYPLRKLDMVAIPDFSAGAMENWGLVTYRETALLYDAERSSQIGKQWVALVVAHELAHQWFGNIVTMEFWTQLWLNEGFATWVEYLAVNELFPDWHIWTQFVSLDLGRALRLDALLNSHPVEVEVKYAHEVDEIFDAISYSKGSCVIRMLVAYLGEEAFRAGLGSYLKRFMYANAETKDLWQALEEATNKPVASVMGTWTLQTGFPVVTVSRPSRGVLKVRQNRFLASGPAPPAEDKQTWGIPLQILCGVGKKDGSSPAAVVNQLFLLREDEVIVPGDAAWLKLNSGQNGLYRVLYPDDMLSELLGSVRARDPRLTASDRLGLQDDAFALTRAGLMGMRRLLQVVDAFAGEEEYTVWNDLSANLGGVAALLSLTDEYDAFSKWGSSLYVRMADRLGWDKKDGEGGLTTLLRSTVLGMLLRFRHQATTDEALRRFDRYTEAEARGASQDELSRLLLPDLRGSVFGVAVSQRGRPAYDAVFGHYSRTDLNEEKVRCLGALGAAADKDLLREVLEFGFNPDKVRPQDVMYVLGTVQANRNGSELAWSYLRETWPSVVDRHGGSFMMSRIIQGLGSFVTDEKAAEVEEFFSKAPCPGGERAVQQTLEKIRSNAAWLKRDLPEIKEFLAQVGKA